MLHNVLRRQNRYGFMVEDSVPTFNAGVYGINFDLWRSRNVHKEVQYWLEEVRKSTAYICLDLWCTLFN